MQQKKTRIGLVFWYVLTGSIDCSFLYLLTTFWCACLQLLHFDHCAGLNLQMECHNLILFTPLYEGEGGGTGNAVNDVSKELQAIGRVYRAGQPNPEVNLYRIEVEGPEGEECLDGYLLRRNQDEETKAMAINAGDD